MTVASEEKLIRRWVERLQPFGRGRTYTPALRQRILEYVDLAKAAGLGEVESCKAIGVSPTSIRAWRRAAPAADGADAAIPFEFDPSITSDEVAEAVAPPSKALVPVEVTPSTIHLGGALAFVTPSGFRVEGLSVDQAAALLREFL